MVSKPIITKSYCSKKCFQNSIKNKHERKNASITSWSCSFFLKFKLQCININESYFSPQLSTHVYMIDFEHIIINGDEVRVNTVQMFTSASIG